MSTTSSISKQSILPEKYLNLGQSTEQITDGYGEYIAYDSTGTPLSEDAFESIYINFNALLRNPTIDYSVTEQLTKTAKQISPTMEIAFVPRTLYELLYIVVAIERDAICKLQNTMIYQERIDEYLEKNPESKNTCWHQIIFSDKNPLSEDHPNLFRLAYMLNQHIVAELNLHGGHLTGREITQLVESKVDFLRQHADTFENKFDYRSHLEATGLSLHFGLTRSFGSYASCFNMGIRSERHVQLIRNAVALECDVVARNAFIAYRAGSWQKDTQIDPKFISNKSLSYGTGLFAGAVNDGGATVAYYGIGQNRDIYAVVIPFNEYAASPIRFPTTSALMQMLSKGEFFHARSVVVLSGKSETILGIHLSSGMWGADGKPNSRIARLIAPLISNLSAEALVNSLNTYHQQAYLLG